MHFLEFFGEKRKSLQASHQLRNLYPPKGIDFCSNDYLSFSTNQKLKQNIIEAMSSQPLGSTGSRLLRGQSQHIEQLEEALAHFCRSVSALFFPSGYQANLGLFSTILRENACVFSDERIHASIIDGIRLSGCEKYIWAHNDLSGLEMFLKQKARPDKLNFVVVESIYSMTGSFAPLKEICNLCHEYGAHLIVDEAHATGLFGKNGSGRLEEENLREKVFASIHTAGKALGVSGAWVAGSHELKELMINLSRPLIYSTAPSFYQQVALLKSIEFLSENKTQLIPSFFENILFLQKSLASFLEKEKILGIGGPVTGIVLGSNEKALSLASHIKNRGFDVRAIRPPSVPKGEAMIRLTVPLERTKKEMTGLVEEIKKGLQE